jgi:hypothetical protein
MKIIKKKKNIYKNFKKKKKKKMIVNCIILRRGKASSIWQISPTLDAKRILFDRQLQLIHKLQAP